VCASALQAFEMIDLVAHMHTVVYFFVAHPANKVYRRRFWGLRIRFGCGFRFDGGPDELYNFWR
jgi:hypothetical protein